METVVDSDDGGKQPAAVEKACKLLEDSKGPVAIFSHPCPDPDALGSMMGLAWFLNKLGVECDCFADGNGSHPQNLRFQNLLLPTVRPVNEYRPTDYALNVTVDTIPIHTVCPKETDFGLVIDHHAEIPNGTFRGYCLNLRAGSCSATVYQMIRCRKLKFDEDNDADSKVATGLMIGIATDTENLTSDDTTEYEHQAYRELFEYRNPAALRQILKYKIPREWIEARAKVATNAADRIKNGILVHGVGYLTVANRDLIAAIADEMLSWEGVETAVAFGVIDGDRVEGSVRSSNPALAVPTLCKELGQPHGSGGGKLAKGAYSYPLGSCACDDDMDQATLDRLWEFLNDRETKRVMRTLRK